MSIPCPCEDSQCGIELSQLPLLSDCPNDNEYVIFGNAEGGLGEGQYARRLWSTVKACIALSKPSPYDFNVDSDSFIVTGATTKIITNFIGYNLLFIRNTIPQSTNDTGGTYYAWNKITGQLDIVGAAVEGEPFQLYAL